MRMATNPYLQRVASFVREVNTTIAVRTFVSTNRQGAESLDDMARRLGVSRIIRERLPFEGGLLRLPDGELVIKLNAQSSFVRQRFTLAHEVAHLLLRTEPAFRGNRKSDVYLERACDVIAAELLMPSAEAADFVRDLGSPSPEKLSTIASRYSVSMQTAAIRVHNDFKLWKCCIGMWSVAPKIKTLWFVGPKRWDNVQPDASLVERATSSNASFQTKDLWRRGEVTEPVWLNLLGVGSTSAIGLVHFVN